MVGLKCFRHLGLAMSGVIFIAGCASGPSTYNLQGQADPILNRDENGRSLSVVVRIYQLKLPTEFSKLTFDGLASGKPDTELLGTDLLEKSEIVVVPGTQHISSEKLGENTQYIGIAALFRTPDPHLWRYLIPASQVKSKGIAFRLHDCYIALVNGKAEPIPGQMLDKQPNCVNAYQADNLKKAPTATATPSISQPSNTQPAQTDPLSANKKKKSTARKTYDTAKEASQAPPPAPSVAPTPPVFTTAPASSQPRTLNNGASVNF